MSLTRSSFVICLCPLAKIFQPAEQKRLIKDPALVFKEEPFPIMVAKPSGAVHFAYNKPKQVNDMDLLQWLTGGENGDLSRETEYTGLVYLPVKTETLDALANITSEMMSGADPAEIQKKLNKSLLGDKQKAEMTAAKELSKFRVMRQIKTVHSNLQKQYDTNKENNLGLYQPSDSELLCSFVLAAELEQSTKERQAIAEQFAKLMDRTRTA